MLMTKEDAKAISPKLATNTRWHTYVDWFWKYPEFRANASYLAAGFEFGAR